MATEGTGTYRSALGHRRFRSLLASHAASQMGQSLFTVAVTVVVWEKTQSAAWVAAAASSRLLPYVLFSTVAGVVADRYDRRRVLQAASAVRAVFMVLLVVTAVVDAPVLVILALAFAATVAGTVCYPAVAALIPQAVATRDLAAANVLFTTLESTAFIVGPALGGLLLVVGPPELAFAVNGVMFAVAMVTMRPVRDLRGAPAQAGAEERFLRQLTEGFRAVLGSGSVAVPLLLMVVVNLVYGMSLVVVLLIATDLMDVGAQGFGFLNAALGVGAFAVVAVSNRLASGAHPLRILTWAVIASGVPFAALAVVDWLPAAMVLLVVAGAGSVLTEVVAVTILQRSLDDNVLARVFGILDATVIGSVLLGSAIAPAVVRVFGLRWALVIGGAAVPLLAVAAAPRLLRMSRAAGRRRDELAVPVALLGGLPVLRATPTPVLESIAAAMPLETHAPGATIIAQGDEPDDFYVVVAGRLTVHLREGREERQINTLGPGDGFGEIGLLEGIPRTATVRAAEDVQLYRLAGEHFLAAVNSAPAAAGSTPGGGLVGRMARTFAEAEALGTHT